jgi:hypothetical protein
MSDKDSKDSAVTMKDRGLTKICLNYVSEKGGMRTRTCFVSTEKLPELIGWLDRESIDA